MARSIFYQSPFLYKLGLRFIHRENFEKRYKFLAGFVERGDLVLEPGCGPAIFADFLPKNSIYYGFDLNENFLNYAKKKYLKVYFGNILDQKNYFPAEIVISIDILHHLKEEDRKIFIENCWKATKKKLIICEPYKSEGQSKWWFEKIEKDGINSPKFEDLWQKDILKKEAENGFGKIKNFYLSQLTELGKDLIVIYSKII